MILFTFFYCVFNDIIPQSYKINSGQTCQNHLLITGQKFLIRTNINSNILMFTQNINCAVGVCVPAMLESVACSRVLMSWSRVYCDSRSFIRLSWLTSCRCRSPTSCDISSPPGADTADICCWAADNERSTLSKLTINYTHTLHNSELQ